MKLPRARRMVALEMQRHFGTGQKSRLSHSCNQVDSWNEEFLWYGDIFSVVFNP